MVRHSLSGSVLVCTFLFATACDPERPPENPPVVQVAAPRPSVADVARALSRDDIVAANRILNAIAADGDPTAIRDSRALILLHNASSLTGESKLALLGRVIQSGGPNAAQAAVLARAEELREVSALLEELRATQALALLSRFFGDSPGDAEVDEARAKAYDVAQDLCRDPACRYLNASNALAWAASPEHAAKARAARAELETSLEFHEMAGETTAQRLLRLAAFHDVAGAAAKTIAADADIIKHAEAARDWAQSERDHVPLLGNDENTAAELLGVLQDQSATVAVASSGPIQIYLNFDGHKVCRGVYVVGVTAGSRAVDPSDDALGKLVAQVFGHTVSLRPPLPTTTASSWTEHGTAVTARWRSGELMELRIGDATP